MLERRGRRAELVSVALVAALVAVATTALLHGRGHGGAAAPIAPVGGGAMAPARPVTRIVARPLPVRLARVEGAPASLVWAAGAVWIADGRRVLGIDPATLGIVSQAPVAAQCEDSQIAAGFGAVWLTSGHCTRPGRVTRIDPATGRPGWHVRIPAMAEGVAAWVGAGRLVITTLEGGTRWALAEVDPVNRRVNGVSGTLRGADPATAGLTTLVAAPGGLWAEPAGFGGVARLVLRGKRLSGTVLYPDREKAGIAYGDVRSPWPPGSPGERRAWPWAEGCSGRRATRPKDSPGSGRCRRHRNPGGPSAVQDPTCLRHRAGCAGNASSPSAV